MDPVSLAEFWNGRYLASDTGWDKGACAPPIARLLAEPVVSRGRVAVVGAGTGHEAIAAAKAGLNVTAVDFAASACEAMRVAAAKAACVLEVLQEDVFDLGRRYPGHFDAVLEHTCFCAIDPARRAEYVAAIHGALGAGGRLFGLFYVHGRPGGPPFDTSEAEVRRLFEGRFALERLRPAPDSFPGRAGQELEFVFVKA